MESKTINYAINNLREKDIHQVEISNNKRPKSHKKYNQNQVRL